MKDATQGGLHPIELVTLGVCEPQIARIVARLLTDVADVSLVVHRPVSDGRVTVEVLGREVRRAAEVIGAASLALMAAKN